MTTGTEEFSPSKRREQWRPNERQVEELIKLVNSRYTLDEIAGVFGVHRMTVKRRLDKMGLHTKTSIRKIEHTVKESEPRDSAKRVVYCAICGDTNLSNFFGNDSTLCKSHRKEHKEKLDSMI